MDVEPAEALYRIGWLRPGQLQEAALALLEANYYGPAILWCSGYCVLAIHSQGGSPRRGTLINTGKHNLIAYWNSLP